MQPASSRRLAPRRLRRRGGCAARSRERGMGDAPPGRASTAHARSPPPPAAPPPPSPPGTSGDATLGVPYDGIGHAPPGRASTAWGMRRPVARARHGGCAARSRERGMGDAPPGRVSAAHERSPPPTTERAAVVRALPPGRPGPAADVVGATLRGRPRRFGGRCGLPPIGREAAGGTVAAVAARDIRGRHIGRPSTRTSWQWTRNRQRIRSHGGQRRATLGTDIVATDGLAA